jgi:transcriptional regulator with XRE-family HTH domain
MPKSVFSGEHSHVVRALVEARRKAGLTQAEVARRIGKDQTFISLIERSQRRVDVLEFYALARAMGVDPVELYGRVVDGLPRTIAI